MTTIHLLPNDNMTEQATSKLVEALSIAYECFTGTSEQALANRIYSLMTELENIEFVQQEGSDDMSTAMPNVL